MSDAKQQGLGTPLCGWANGVDQADSQESARTKGFRSTQVSPPARQGTEAPARPALAVIVAMARAIENEIIPRLLQARHDAEVRMKALDKPTMPEEVVEFAELVLSGDEAAVQENVNRLREDGVSIETLYLELFTGTARRLGEFWTADRCNFVQVTLGMMLLQRLVRDLEADFQAEAPAAFFGGHSSLLLALPGEQHNLGLSIVAQYFRRDGWDVFGEMFTSSGALVDMVRDHDFNMIGLSASCDVHLEAMASRIAMVRRASRNKSIVIMVGGHVFNEHPALVSKVGADMTAVDGRSAVLAARTMMEGRILKVR